MINRKYLAAVPVAALALAGLGLGTARAATVPVTYQASIGKAPLVLSANDGGSAVANAGDTLSLTVGTPTGPTDVAYAKAVLTPPAGSVIPAAEPVFTTDHFSTGSPRLVITLANGDELMNNQSSATAAAAPGTAAWSVNTGSGWSNTLETYAQALATVGAGQVVKTAEITADNDQAPGTVDVISGVQYGGANMTVRPAAAVPFVFAGHDVSVTQNTAVVGWSESAKGWPTASHCVEVYMYGFGNTDGKAHVGFTCDNGDRTKDLGYLWGLSAGHSVSMFVQPATGTYGNHHPIPGTNAEAHIDVVTTR